MSKRGVVLSLILLLFSGALSLATAQTLIASDPDPDMESQTAAPAAAPAADQPKPKQADAAKTAQTPTFTFGADLRVRWEFYENARTLCKTCDSHESSYIRWRYRIFGSINPSKDFSFNWKLTGEPRTQFNPNVSGGKPVPTWYGNEAIVDTLNFRLGNPKGKVVATLGRQDIMLGNGWLVMDGTPGDGSRTLFFDALRTTFNINKKSSLDVIYIDQPATSKRIPPFGWDHVKTLTDQDERGAILNYTNKPSQKAQIDAYFIYKHDRKLREIPSGDDANIYVLGARVDAQLSNKWRIRSEIAPETGTKNGDSLRAFGMNNRLSYLTKDKYNNNFRIGYEMLTGNNPDTSGKNEAFDPLWGRWPQWSELLVYTVLKEGRVAEQTNIHRINLGWGINPTKKIEISADYHALFADENTMRGKPGFSATGKFRGHLLTSWLRFTINKHLKGHLMGEVFLPGSYFAEPMKNTAVFIRPELIFSW